MENSPSWLEQRNCYGETPLLAIELYQGDLRSNPQQEGARILGLIESYVKQGADVNAQAGDGSLLHKVAAYFLNEMTLDDAGEEVFKKIIYLLVELGADVNLRDEDGKTPLHYAQFNEWQDSCSKFLLECGADINAQDYAGWTPLITSINRAIEQSLAERFIHWGADLNLQDREGCTALHHAVKKGFNKLVAALLAHGANPDIVNNAGKTAARLAAGNPEALRHLGGEPPLIGQVENSEEARQKRAGLRDRAQQFRDEVIQAESAFRLSARWQWRKCCAWIAIAMVSPIFGVPGLMMSAAMIVLLVYYAPLSTSFRHEVAAEMCRTLSSALRNLMDSSAHPEHIAGELAAMERMREQLQKM